ncbi:hypothetical protein FSP39_011814 [Pinctada imbricata]|uniref:FAM21/CAPZIP domain-containing protein n=1 Tax=Pinctada imbricata TaxID=66713 RepID=A0AA88XLY9_PINIB|nr:hypothetical protein FSP39_011814 [Pinctada imbricata]
MATYRVCLAIVHLSDHQSTCLKKEEKTRSGSLFDTEEGDEEDLFGVPAKPKDSEKKKPIGGVSLFGGANILGNKTKQEEKIIEKVQDSVKPAVTSKLSLFNDEDDVEEDLFGGGATPVESIKPLSAQVKPVTKGKGLFEDEDLLFGENLGESPGVDIFSKSPPEVSDGPMNVEGSNIMESAKSEVPTEEPKSRKPIGGVSMFGGLDPMAALKKKEQTEPSTEEKAQASSVEKGKKAGQSTDSLFGEDEEEDNLFGGSSSKPSKQVPPKSKDNLFGSPKSDDDLFSPKLTVKSQEEPAEVKPKKPAGAVSMFGGVDPFSAMKKKSHSVEEKDIDNKPNKEKPSKDNIYGSPKSDDDLFGSTQPDSKSDIRPPPGAVSMFGGVHPSAAIKQKSSSIEEKDNPAPTSPSTEDMNIRINPAALLPGATPPNKEAETMPVGFDVPAEANTLHSANKERAKIQVKRRPPSRRGRQTPTVQPVSNGIPDTTEEPSTPASFLPDLPPLDKPPPATKDLFGNDDLLAESISSNVVISEKQKSKEGDMFNKEDNDLFSSKEGKGKSAMTNEDLFGNSKTEIRTKSKQAISVDNEEDIFGSSSVTPKKATAVESAILNGGRDTSADIKEEQKSVLDDDEDDIFAKPRKRATDYEKLFDKDAEEDKSKEFPKKDDKPSIVVDDDIFADSSLSKKKEPKVKKEEEAAVQKPNKADEEVDDIFAVKTTKKVKARPKTKDEDLFKDETDIFADVPAAKPKEKKKKKATEKKTGIFKDDVDDIFADVSTPKIKKETKKKESTKTKSVDIDIFDDPLK